MFVSAYMKENDSTCFTKLQIFRHSSSFNPRYGSIGNKPITPDDSDLLNESPRDKRFGSI